MTPNKGVKILVADDSPVIRAMVKRALEQADCQVLLAENGAEALALFEREHPQIIVTDWMMPDLSGLDLCKAIRATGKSYVYIVILTGLTQKEKLVQALETGADDYLTKPFHPGELVARVRVGIRIVQLQMELAEKNGWLEQLSLTDPLTSLPNRRAIEEWAIRELNTAKRHGEPLCFVLVDLDHFKAVNDTHGHAAGDAVLRKFADLLRADLRADDACGRMGGEEFLLVLPRTSVVHAVQVGERLRSRIASQSTVFENNQILITASFGIGVCHAGDDAEFSRLLRAADSALYCAKKNGRNRVEVAPELPGPVVVQP